MTQRRGIILAGGSGTRLRPITSAISKQILPIYDKPMIYYPLSVLMLSQIREVAIITTPRDREQFEGLLGDGSAWGMSFTFITQPEPEGLAQAYLLAEDFLDGHPSTMVLGDNIFFGHGLPDLLQEADKDKGGTVFGYHVTDPERYGVVEFDDAFRALSIEEKPAVPKSNYAVTGLYALDGRAPELAGKVEKSERGELEITSLLSMYLDEGSLDVRRMGRGYAWLDTGTMSSLLDAGNFVRTLQNRQNVMIGCPEEIAFQQGWINRDDLRGVAMQYRKSAYGEYLLRLADMA